MSASKPQGRQGSEAPSCPKQPPTKRIKRESGAAAASDAPAADLVCDVCQKTSKEPGASKTVTQNPKSCWTDILHALVVVHFFAPECGLGKA